MFKCKIKYINPQKGERFASALTNMNLNNKVIKKFGKINLKDYINTFLTKNNKYTSNFFMFLKNYLTKILVKFFSKFNRKEGKDLLDVFEKLILFSKGKHRGFYDINFEISEILKLAKLIDVKNIIDIGAHKGLYSELLLKHYPNANFYLFEPQKNLYKNLTEKFSDKKFHIYNFGLSNQNKS